MKPRIHVITLAVAHLDRAPCAKANRAGLAEIGHAT